MSFSIVDTAALQHLKDLVHAAYPVATRDPKIEQSLCLAADALGNPNSVDLFARNRELQQVATTVLHHTFVKKGALIAPGTRLQDLLKADAPAVHEALTKATTPRARGV